MKKFITLMLTAALALTMCMSFAACNGNNNSVSNKIKMLDVKLSEEQYGIAVSKTNDGLLETVNTVLSEKATEIAALIKKYEGKDYNDDDAAIDGTYVEGVVAYQTGMSSDEYLVLATDYPFAPFEYMVGTNFGGIDIEIGKLIADKLGKKLAVKYVAFDLICTAVNGGDADLGLAGLTITEARKQTVNFSKPYYTGAYQVLVVMEDDATFDNCKTAEDVDAILKAMANGTKVGSQTGSTGFKFIAGDKDESGFSEFKGYSNLTVKGYTTHADAARDMVNGAVKFCVVDNLVASSIVAQINASAK